MEKGFYIYGILDTNENRSFGSIGIFGRRVYTIPYQDMAALISKAPLTPFMPTKKTALGHENVIRKAMEHQTVIPMGFGVVARSKDQVEDILKRGHLVFKNTFERMRGKVQVDVKVLWNRKKILFEILKEDKKIQKLRARVMARGESKIRDDKIELGKMVYSKMEKKKEEIVEDIRNNLNELAEDSCSKRLTDENMIMNRSFLVAVDKRKEFHKKADELEEKYGDELKLLAAIGPLPPYNFTHIEMKTPDFESIEDARKVLGLGKTATIAEIESVFDNLAPKFHPDKNPDPSAEEQFKKLQHAHALLTEYCNHYPISFKESEVKKNIMVIEKPKKE